MLTSPSTASLVWTLTSAAPVSWQIWTASVIGGPYSLASTIAGSNTSTGATPGLYAYIIGVDGGGNQTVAQSNTVQVHS